MAKSLFVMADECVDERTFIEFVSALAADAEDAETQYRKNASTFGHLGARSHTQRLKSLTTSRPVLSVSRQRRRV